MDGIAALTTSPYIYAIFVSLLNYMLNYRGPLCPGKSDDPNINNIQVRDGTSFYKVEILVLSFQNICHNNRKLLWRRRLTVQVSFRMYFLYYVINTPRPRQDGQHFLDYIFKCIFLNKNV